MNLRKFDIGVLVAIVSSIIGFAFYLGNLDASVKELKVKVNELKPDIIKIRQEEAIDAIDERAQSIFAAPGTIVPYGGTITTKEDIPKGWLLCDGSELPDEPKYNSLRKILENTAWGRRGAIVYLPDLRGLFLRGVDDPDGEGDIWSPANNDSNPVLRINPITKNNSILVGSLQMDSTKRPDKDFKTNMQGSHQHDIPKGGGENDGGQWTDTGERPGKGSPVKTVSSGAHDHTINDGGDAETRPKNAYVNWLIKY